MSSTLLLESPLVVPTRPRVEVAPSYVDSYGPEAVALMARAGKALDPWQVDAVTLLLAVGADDMWACFEYVEMCSRQNGKGAILEARALAGFLLLGEQLIMWSAHQYKTAKDAFRRMRSLFRALGQRVNDNLILLDGIYIKIHNTHGEEGFERLDTEARIKFIARSKDSGRGMSGDLNIIDEAYDYTTDQQEALGPTLLAVPNPQFVYTSSPPLSADTGEILYGLRERAEQMLASGVDEALGYRDWGLVGDLDNLGVIDVDDHRLWAAANPALCNGRLTIGKIAKLKKMLRSARGFARECLGLWPVRQKSGGVIDMTRWSGPLLDERVKSGLPPTSMVGRVALGVDVAPDRSTSAIGAAGRRADQLLSIERVEGGTGTRWTVPYLKGVVTAQNPLAIVIDPGSTAGSLIGPIEKMLAGLREDPNVQCDTVLVEVSGREYAQSCGLLMDLMEAEQVRHIGQKSLTDAAEGATTRRVGDAWAWDRRRPSVDLPPLPAVTLALHGFLEHESDEDNAVEPWIHFGDEDDD